MLLWLDRYERHPAGGTFGRLFWVQGDLQHQLCFTLEDIVRHPRPWDAVTAPVADWKVYGQTAIPPGRYEIVITRSARFQMDLPLLVDVPGFTGVRLHSGNVIEDTDGCLLVGLDRPTTRAQKAWLGRSRAALQVVLSYLRAQPGPHRLTIIESYPPPIP